jgi:hypothetical protein
MMDKALIYFLLRNSRPWWLVVSLVFGVNVLHAKNDFANRQKSPATPNDEFNTYIHD